MVLPNNRKFHLIPKTLDFSDLPELQRHYQAIRDRLSDERQRQNSRFNSVKDKSDSHILEFIQLEHLRRFQFHSTKADKVTWQAFFEFWSKSGPRSEFANRVPSWGIPLRVDNRLGELRRDWIFKIDNGSLKLYELLWDYIEILGRRYFRSHRDGPRYSPVEAKATASRIVNHRKKESGWQARRAKAAQANNPRATPRQTQHPSTLGTNNITPVRRRAIKPQSEPTFRPGPFQEHNLQNGTTQTTTHESPYSNLSKLRSIPPSLEQTGQGEQPELPKTPPVGLFTHGRSTVTFPSPLGPEVTAIAGCAKRLRASIVNSHTSPLAFKHTSRPPSLTAVQGTSRGNDSDSDTASWGSVAEDFDERIMGALINNPSSSRSTQAHLSLGTAQIDHTMQDQTQSQPQQDSAAQGQPKRRVRFKEVFIWEKNNQGRWEPFPSHPRQLRMTIEELLDDGLTIRELARRGWTIQDLITEWHLIGSQGQQASRTTAQVQQGYMSAVDGRHGLAPAGQHRPMTDISRRQPATGPRYSDIPQWLSNNTYPHPNATATNHSRLAITGHLPSYNFAPVPVYNANVNPASIPGHPAYRPNGTGHRFAEPLPPITTPLPAPDPFTVSRETPLHQPTAERLQTEMDALRSAIDTRNETINLLSTYLLHGIITFHRDRNMALHLLNEFRRMPDMGYNEMGLMRSQLRHSMDEARSALLGLRPHLAFTDVIGDISRHAEEVGDVELAGQLMRIAEEAEAMDSVEDEDEGRDGRGEGKDAESVTETEIDMDSN